MKAFNQYKLMVRYLKIMAGIAAFSGIMDVITWFVTKFMVPCIFLGFTWLAAAILIFCSAKLYEKLDRLENERKVM